MGLSGADLKTCQDAIANYIPKILKHMFNGFEKEKRAENLCKHLFKVCKKPEFQIGQNLNNPCGGCDHGCHCSCSGHTCHCKC